MMIIIIIIIIINSGRADIKGRVTHWATRVGSKSELLVQTLQKTIWMVTKNRQCSNLGPLESTQTDTRPKKKEKRHKWSREELKENFDCFYYALEIHQKFVQQRKHLRYKLWRERNKTERLYIDPNMLASVRRAVMKKKLLNFRKLKMR